MLYQAKDAITNNTGTKRDSVVAFSSYSDDRSSTQVTAEVLTLCATADTKRNERQAAATNGAVIQSVWICTWSWNWEVLTDTGNERLGITSHQSNNACGGDVDEFVDIVRQINRRLERHIALHY